MIDNLMLFIINFVQGKLCGFFSTQCKRWPNWKYSKKKQIFLYTLTINYYCQSTILACTAGCVPQTAAGQRPPMPALKDINEAKSEQQVSTGCSSRIIHENK